MITSKKPSSNFIKLLLVAVLFVGCQNGCKEKTLINTQNYKVGEKYLLSFDWEEKNPFENIRIDTVKVTGVKDGYVEWEYKNGFRQSSEEKIFERIVKHCH